MIKIANNISNLLAKQASATAATNLPFNIHSGPTNDGSYPHYYSYGDSPAQSLTDEAQLQYMFDQQNDAYGADPRMIAASINNIGSQIRQYRGRNKLGPMDYLPPRGPNSLSSLFSQSQSRLPRKYMTRTLGE